MIRDLIRGASSGASEGARNMIQQDVERGRQTEVGYLNGLVVRKGREAGVPTPVNEAILAVFPRLELGELSPALENLELVTPR
jgi:2-dehydropantoate 2-reductase